MRGSVAGAHRVVIRAAKSSTKSSPTWHYTFGFWHPQIQVLCGFLKRPNAPSVEDGSKEGQPSLRRNEFNRSSCAGKKQSREEIAGLIGVTVGSLQVTCSKLGISLRRPRINPQNDLPGPGIPCSGTVISSPSQVTPVRFAFEQVDQFLQSAQEAEPEAGALRPDESGKQKATAPVLP